MAEPPEELSPIAAAMEWVARITTVALEMVIPGLAGQWADQKFGTNYLGLLGFAFGVTAGIWHLVAISKTNQKRSFRQQQEKSSRSDSAGQDKADRSDDDE